MPQHIQYAVNSTVVNDDHQENKVPTFFCARYLYVGLEVTALEEM